MARSQEQINLAQDVLEQLSKLAANTGSKTYQAKTQKLCASFSKAFKIPQRYPVKSSKKTK